VKHKYLLVTDLRVRDHSGSKLLEFTNLLIFYYVLMRLRLLNCFGAVQVYTCNSFKVFLSAHGYSNDSIYTVETDAYEIKSSADFKRLHHFIDKLDSSSTLLGREGKFTAYESALINLLEARWTGELFDDVLWYLDGFSHYVRGRSYDKIIFCGRSVVLTYLAKLISPKTGKPRFDLPTRMLRIVENILIFSRMKVAALQVRRFAFKEIEKVFSNPEATENPSSKRLLVVATINRSLERLLPAMSYLVESGYNVNIIANARVSILEKLQEKGARCFYFGNFVGRVTCDVFGRGSESSPRPVIRELTKKIPSKAYSWRGVNLYDLARETIIRTLTVHASQAFLAYRVAEIALEDIHPDIILCFEDSELPRAITLLARRHNVPSIGYIPHSPAITPGLLRRSQDHLFVGGTILKELMSPWRRGGRIDVIGDTLVDDLVSKKNSLNPGQFWNQHGIKADKGVIGVLSTWPDHSLVTLAEIKNQLKKAFELAEQLNYSVVIKSHPLQDIESVKRWVDDLGKWANIIQDCSLLDFCTACSLIVSPLSTAVMQAMMAEIPVVHFQNAETDICVTAHKDYGFANDKGVRCITEGENQLKIASDLICDPEARYAQVSKGKTYVEQHVGQMDGCSSLRLLAALAKSTEAVKLSRHNGIP
jgi:hypothetical protein